MVWPFRLFWRFTPDTELRDYSFLDQGCLMRYLISSRGLLYARQMYCLLYHCSDHIYVLWKECLWVLNTCCFVLVFNFLLIYFLWFTILLMMISHIHNSNFKSSTYFILGWSAAFELYVYLLHVAVTWFTIIRIFICGHTMLL